MITIFSNPRPFVDIFDRIQRNAIESWLALEPKCQIILFEDEKKTTGKIAKEYGIQCINEVEFNKYGTPLLNDVFAKVQIAANFNVLTYVNSDIILTNDFVQASTRVAEVMGTSPFYMVGRRIDVDLEERIDFTEKNWEGKLRNFVEKNGILHGYSGMDYWTFPRDLNFNIPPFAKGRMMYDSWLIFRARELKLPVIDATAMVTAIHQNHYYPQKKSDHYALEVRHNIAVAGGLTCGMTLLDSTWILQDGELIRPPLKRWLFSSLSMWYPIRWLRAVKRKQSTGI